MPNDTLTKFGEAAQAMVLQRKRERLWGLMPEEVSGNAGAILADFIGQLNEEQLDSAILNHSVK